MYRQTPLVEGTHTRTHTHTPAQRVNKIKHRTEKESPPPCIAAKTSDCTELFMQYLILDFLNDSQSDYKNFSDCFIYFAMAYWIYLKGCSLTYW